MNETRSLAPTDLKIETIQVMVTIVPPDQGLFYLLPTPLCPLLPSFTFTIMPFVDTPFIFVSLTKVLRK